VKNYNQKLLAIAISLASGVAFADGKIEGQIKTKDAVHGLGDAKVTLNELQRSVITTGGGRFIFDNVPAGRYTLLVDYVGAKPITREIVVEDDLVTRSDISLESLYSEEILVQGQAAGAAGALNRQRHAQEILSVVDADAIGELSDANVTEALNRLSGISIESDQGEGRFVRIRGAGADLNTVTVNGITVPSPEAGSRAVALDVIPSELVEMLEVSKTSTPDKDANSLGGNIEIKSTSAFDRPDGAVTAKVAANYNTNSEETTPKASFSLSKLFADETLGVAAAISYEERNMVTHNVETDGAWEPQSEFDFDNSGSFDDHFTPPEVEQRFYDVTRKRLGTSLNINYRPTDNSEYYVRTLYSNFEDNEIRQKVEWKFEDASQIADLTAASGTVYDGFEMQRELKKRDEEQSIFSTAIGGDWYGDVWNVSASLGYSVSEEKEPGRYDAVFENKFEDSMAEATWNGTEQPILSGSDVIYDASGFELDEIVILDGVSSDDQLQYQIDFERDFPAFGTNGALKFGAKGSARETKYDVESEVWTDFDTAGSLAQFSNGNFPYPWGQRGPEVSSSLVGDFIAAAQEGRDYEVDELASIEETFAPQYEITEDTTALYAMHTIEWQDTSLIYGVRWQTVATDLMGYDVELQVTEDLATGDDIETIDVVARNYSSDEDFLLPSIHLKHKLNASWQTRAAITTSAVRPTFDQMSPSAFIENDNGDLEGEFGNPELDAMKSTGLDWTIEYYGQENLSNFTAGLFYKDITDFIYETDVSSLPEWSHFDEAISYRNSDSASIAGAEVAYVKRFNSGFLVTANATMTDSEANYTSRETTSLPGQSDLSANFIVGWENEHLSARLATSYKSKYLISVDLDESAKDTYQDAQTNIDFSLRADVAGFEVSFDALNITNEPYYAYTGSSKYNLQYEEYGRSYRLGFKWNNF